MGGTDLLGLLRTKAADLPVEGPPLVLRARQRALEAVDTAATALRVDPTLAAEDQCQDIDLQNELLHQIKPLARQVTTDAERRRLAAPPWTEEQLARLGRANPRAAEELDALSQRCTVLD